MYTEAEKRSHGVAGALLNYVCVDMKDKGIDTLYLLTDHTSFYERYGWEFFCMARGSIIVLTGFWLCKKVDEIRE